MSLVVHLQYQVCKILYGQLLKKESLIVIKVVV